MEEFSSWWGDWISIQLSAKLQSRGSCLSSNRNLQTRRADMDQGLGAHSIKALCFNLPHKGAVWHLLINNGFQYLNNNNISDTYFYNTQICIFTILKTKQQYLNTATKQAQNHSIFKTNMYYLEKLILYLAKLNPTPLQRKKSSDVLHPHQSTINKVLSRSNFIRHRNLEKFLMLIHLFKKFLMGKNSYVTLNSYYLFYSRL